MTALMKCVVVGLNNIFVFVNQGWVSEDTFTNMSKLGLNV